MTGNVADLLRHAARDFPTAPALITDTAQWTWSQLDRAADAGAAALLARGLAAGERVLIHLPTGPELAAALFAVARADLVAVPVDPHRDAPEIAARLGAAAVLTATPDGVDPDLLVDGAEMASWFEADPAPVHPQRGGEDIVILARASRGGRAVMLSHRALLASVDAIVASPHLQLRARDRVLLVLPLFHLAGFVTAFLPLTTVGAAAVVADTPPVTGPNVVGTGAWKMFSAAVLDAIHRHRVTVIPGAPPLYRLLLRSTEFERSLATVRLMTSAASPLSLADGAAVRARSGSPVWEGYGVSEAASAVASSLMTSAPHPGSVGLPLTGVEIRIEASDDTRDIDWDNEDTLASLEAEADPGPISIRGPQLFSGYWPDGADGPDADGWFTTSDVGYLDKRGELHLIDRIAETILVAGFTVYPREVESALMTHPEVRDAAVVGVPVASPAGGTDLVASIVATAGTAPEHDALDAHLAALLPGFKRPSRYQVVQILPRTELGRLDRDAVRAAWIEALGISDSVDRPSPRLSVVTGARVEPDGPGADGASEKDEPPAAEKPAAKSKPKPAKVKNADPAPSKPVRADKGGETGDGATPGPSKPPVEPPPPPEPPEVIEVSQLDQLGSRLPGIGSRSRRSAEDTDGDLFGEGEFDTVPAPTPPRAGE